MHGFSVLGVSAQTIAGFLVLSALLAVAAVNNYLVFHTVTEMFSVVVGFSAFSLAWYSRRWIGASFLLMLGFGQLFVGVVDTAHTMTYQGWGLVTGIPFDTTTKLWISGRFMEAAAFLVAILWPMAHFSPRRVVAVFTLALAGIAALLMTETFPDCYIQGQGLTTFKIAAEYVIVALFAAALARLRLRPDDFDPVVRRLLFACLGFKIAAELSFTLYTDAYGITNMIGHLLKIVGSYLFLRAIVETGLNRPQAMIFGSLEREKALSTELQRHATTLDAVLDASMDAVVLMDAQGRMRFASTAAEDFFGLSADELSGMSWAGAGLPADAARALDDMCGRVVKARTPSIREITLDSPEGLRWLEVQASPVRPSGGGDIGAVVVALRDISSRKEMEEDLRASVEENRVLMLEVHHRVKNNLQIVSSILQMQGWRVSDPAVRSQFDDACGRIMSLAKVHELLYKAHNVASIDMVRYIRTLCDELFVMYGVRSDWVALKIDPGTLSLPLDRAVPLGLIVHELITNSLKHAFTETGGELRISIEAVGPDEGRLVVSDDGQADASPDFDGQSASLGLRMVSVLVKQIHGSIAVRRDAGVAIEVRFPLAAMVMAGMERDLAPVL